MSATRKTRSDSRLKTLPDEKQRAIIELLKVSKLTDVRELLRKDGLVTSVGALSQFGSWWQLRDRFARNQIVVQALLDELKQDNPTISDDQLFATGQRMFSALAIEQQDASAWSQIQRTGLQRRELTLARERFQRETAELFLRWYADQRAGEIAGSTASNADKIARLQQLMFADLNADGHEGQSS